MNLRAAASLSLTGPLALQGRDAARGLRWWADFTGAELYLSDDRSSPGVVEGIYRQWLQSDLDVVLGPYGSNLVRRAVALVGEQGQLMWNHGGAADDLARPRVVPVAAPASSYFRGAVELAAGQGLTRVLLALGPGRFSAAVGAGAEMTARRLGLEVKHLPLHNEAAVVAAARPDTAVLVAGTFEQDAGLVSRLRGAQPGLRCCVAAGLPEFGIRLGSDAEGVVGPVQWLPNKERPEVGPSGAEFAAGFTARFRTFPSYVAAQAAAAAFLAAEFCERQEKDVHGRRTTTLLGHFEVDSGWRQVAHAAATVQWERGRQVPIRD